MRIALALCLALAAATAAAGDTFRTDKGVVVVGDNLGTLTQKVGKPDRIVELQNRRGAAVGERWEYYLRDKQVNFTIAGGRIIEIEETR